MMRVGLSGVHINGDTVNSTCVVHRNFRSKQKAYKRTARKAHELTDSHTHTHKTYPLSPRCAECAEKCLPTVINYEFGSVDLYEPANTGAWFVA